jgi:hypothetical protein
MPALSDAPPEQVLILAASFKPQDTISSILCPCKDWKPNGPVNGIRLQIARPSGRQQALLTTTSLCDPFM